MPNDVEEHKDSIEQVKPKRKRLTAEEKKAKEEANVKARANRAASKARETVARRQAKANAKKAESKASRNVTRRDIKDRLVNMAAHAQLSISENDMKVPEKGAKMNQLQKYFNAAKSRYYKRTKKASSFQRQVLEAAAAEQLDPKYVKFYTRERNVSKLLEKARERKMKNTAKMTKGQKRAEIIQYAQDSLGMSEKDFMSIVCVRKKAEKK